MLLGFLLRPSRRAVWWQPKRRRRLRPPLQARLRPRRSARAFLRSDLFGWIQIAMRKFRFSNDNADHLCRSNESDAKWCATVDIISNGKLFICRIDGRRCLRRIWLSKQRKFWLVSRRCLLDRSKLVQCSIDCQRRIWIGRSFQMAEFMSEQLSTIYFCLPWRIVFLPGWMSQWSSFPWTIVSHLERTSLLVDVFLIVRTGKAINSRFFEYSKKPISSFNRFSRLNEHRRHPSLRSCRSDSALTILGSTGGERDEWMFPNNWVDRRYECKSI